jgi:hypothetical protein
MANTYPTFTDVKVHHKPDDQDCRDPVVVELHGPCHVVKLVLPEGEQFVKRLVAFCFEAIPPALQTVAKKEETLETPF